jgi:hypothetical protein
MMYVLGEKAGQKVPLQPPQQQPAPGMGGMNYPNTAQSMLAHQNRQMEAVERRNAEQRVRSSSANNVSTDFHSARIVIDKSSSDKMRLHR